MKTSTCAPGKFIYGAGAESARWNAGLVATSPAGSTDTRYAQ